MNDALEFRSDNAAGAAEEMMQAVVDANVGSALAYGADEWTERLTAVARDVFEHPDLQIFPVATGTAANSLGLSAMVRPWEAVVCHETAHILRSEAAATSMFSGGAMMIGMPGADYKLAPASIEAAFAATRWGDPHHSQPAVVSFTSPTDYGTVYSIDELRAVTSAAAERGLRGHLDGARMANAISALSCSPADMTWRSGVDVFSLGATKNGAVSTDAIVSFDPAVSEQLVYRLKRAGQNSSKMRFQSAQLLTYLTDGLWLRLAGAANGAMRRLADGLGGIDGIELFADPQANMVFADVESGLVERMASAGLVFYTMADPSATRPGYATIRLVTSFQTSSDIVDDALARIAAVA